MYVYEHTNGNYIFKNDIIVDSIGAADYFNSSFVVNYWWFSTKEEAEEFVKQRSKQ